MNHNHIKNLAKLKDTIEKMDKFNHFILKKIDNFIDKNKKKLLLLLVNILNKTKCFQVGIKDILIKEVYNSKCDMLNCL